MYIKYIHSGIKYSGIKYSHNFLTFYLGCIGQIILPLVSQFLHLQVGITLPLNFNEIANS